MKQLKVGIAGFGWFGKKHYTAWKKILPVSIAGIADPRIQELREGFCKSAQSDFHVDDNHIHIPDDVFSTDSIETLIREKGIDLLDIATTEETHFAVAKAALEAGVDVIVEKPFTLSLDDAKVLFAIAEKNKKNIYVGNILRFDSRNQHIKEQLDRGSIGSLRYLSFKRNFQSRAHLVYGNHSPFFTAMVHDIDLTLWFTGETLRMATPYTRHYLGRKEPDLLLAVLEMDSNLLVRIENIWHVAESCPYGFENEYVLYGEKATLKVANTPIIEMWTQNKVEYPEFFFWPVIDQKAEGALRTMLTHYAECALAQRSSEILPKADVLEGIRIAELLNKGGLA